ncbi:MAG: hypothetical protein M1835_007303 [Candelina submexicana]|nr:MAG: hypothetical protein M1835_007303 [Candelina submexicana]
MEVDVLGGVYVATEELDNTAAALITSPDIDNRAVLIKVELQEIVELTAAAETMKTSAGHKHWQLQEPVDALAALKVERLGIGTRLEEATEPADTSSTTTLVTDEGVCGATEVAWMLVVGTVAGKACTSGLMAGAYDVAQSVIVAGDDTAAAPTEPDAAA